MTPKSILAEAVQKNNHDTELEEAKIHELLGFQYPGYRMRFNDLVHLIDTGANGTNMVVRHDFLEV